MAEHVGIRKMTSFFPQVYNLLEDDGVFSLQVAGLRKPWHFEDLVWGMFLNKCVFPGADASTPPTWYIHFVESAGWEVKTYLGCMHPLYISQSLTVRPVLTRLAFTTQGLSGAGTATG